jgi:recombinational DNA repair protein RecT
VSAFKRPAEQYAQTMTIMDSTTAVFNLMYGAALGLAFVICYNMGLINFTERTRV